VKQFVVLDMVRVLFLYGLLLVGVAPGTVDVVFLVY